MSVRLFLIYIYICFDIKDYFFAFCLLHKNPLYGIFFYKGGVWMNGKIKDLTGLEFGDLIVIRFVEISKHKKALWECLCGCGNKKVIPGGRLSSGAVTSCGCARVKQVGDRFRKHGKTGTRIYSIWRSMKNRCSNVKDKHFKDYGGRGIKIAEDWFNNFESFLKWAEENGYDETLTIERKDVNGNYEPDNCEWISAKEQGLNKRNNRWITINGETKTIAEWERATGISRTTMIRRIKRGIVGADLIKKGRI